MIPLMPGRLVDGRLVIEFDDRGLIRDQVGRGRTDAGIRLDALRCGPDDDETRCGADRCSKGVFP